MSRGLGVLLIVLGLGVIAIGLLIATGALSWFGRLPGDIRVERPGFALYVPIASMLLISVVLSLLAWLIRRMM
jgi:membrane protein implicated in regulation of membrane protease activity